MLLVCASAFHWPFALLWPTTLCHTLYCRLSLCLHSLILYYQSVDTSLSSVFISHSLFLSSLLSPLFLWGKAECVFKGSIPRQPQHCLSSSYLFPHSFPSPPTVSSDFYCQRSDVSKHLSKAPLHSQLFDFQTVARRWALWKLFFHCQVSLFLKTKLFGLFLLEFETMRLMLKDRLSIKRCVICVTTVWNERGTWFIRKSFFVSILSIHI